MLSREDIVKGLKEILVAQNSRFSTIVDKVTDESNLRTDIGLDSIQMLYLVIVIEERFRIEFDNIGLGDFKTFGDIVNYIESKQKA